MPAADATTGSSVVVVVPTYDEAPNLLPLLARIAAAVPGAHVLVVDDASPDGTGALADAAAQRDARVHVLHRAGKAGLGAAYRAGFAWALARDYGVVVEMDADGSHAPEQLPSLLASLGGGPDDPDDPAVPADGLGSPGLVLGSRWVPGGAVVDWPRRREALSRGANLYARLALRLPVHDATGGFRAYRRETLAALDLTEVTSAGYCFQVDLVRRVHAAGTPIAEVPITFVERTAGRSKMDRAVVLEALWRIGAWGVGDAVTAVRSAAGARAGRRAGSRGLRRGRRSSVG